MLINKHMFQVCNKNTENTESYELGSNLKMIPVKY